MTAAELLDHLAALGVSVVPDQAGVLQCLAPKGVMTPRLRAQVRARKTEIIAVLAAQRQPMPETYQAPAPSMYRRWVTGSAPGQFGTYVLAAPLYQTTWHESVTYWGAPCMKKVCQTSVSAAGQSLRFFPSDTCVSCWKRWDKTTRAEGGDDGAC